MSSQDLCVAPSYQLILHSASTFRKMLFSAVQYASFGLFPYSFYMKLSSSLVFALPFGFQTWHFQLLLIFLPLLLLHPFFFFCSCCSWCCHCCNCYFTSCCDCYLDCYHCCCNCYFDSSCCDCFCDFCLGYCCCTSVVILVVIVVVIVVGLFLLMPFLFFCSMLSFSGPSLKI